MAPGASALSFSAQKSFTENPDFVGLVAFFFAVVVAVVVFFFFEVFSVEFPCCDSNDAIIS